MVGFDRQHFVGNVLARTGETDPHRGLQRGTEDGSTRHSGTPSVLYLDVLCWLRSLLEDRSLVGGFLPRVSQFMGREAMDALEERRILLCMCLAGNLGLSCVHAINSHSETQTTRCSGCACMVQLPPSFSPSIEADLLTCFFLFLFLLLLQDGSSEEP